MVGALAVTACNHGSYHNAWIFGQLLFFSQSPNIYHSNCSCAIATSRGTFAPPMHLSVCFLPPAVGEFVAVTTWCHALFILPRWGCASSVYVRCTVAKHLDSQFAAWGGILTATTCGGVLAVTTPYPSLPSQREDYSLVAYCQ